MHTRRCEEMKIRKQIANDRSTSILLRWVIALLTLVAAPLAMSMEPESPETRQGARHWTLSDIVEAPVVTDLAIARVGHRARSEEHTSELQSLMRISYAVFGLKKKTKNIS